MTDTTADVMREPMVTAKPAKVFQGATRRWLTKRAAYRDHAKAYIRECCSCDPGDGWHDPGYPCDWHDMPTEEWSRLVDRLATWFERLDNARALEGGDDGEMG